MFISKENKINCYCYILFGLYFIINLSFYGYGVYFLESFKIPYIVIGITIGVSALITSILQPILGRFIDVHHYSWQKILLILNLIIIISVILMSLTQLYILFFALILIASTGMYPFVVNSVFYYESYGIKTNFGVARGFGALTFCIFSFILGFALNDSGVWILLLLTLISSILMIITIFLLPDYGFSQKEQNEKSKSNILTKYPAFALLLISMVMFMTFQNMFECYMIDIIENVGGSVVNVGISNSISSVLEIPVMFLFLKILKRVPAKNLIMIAGIFYILRAFLIFQAHDTFGIYLSQVFQMLTFAIISPATVHFTNEMMEDIDQYEGQALLGSTITIGLIFANFVGGNVLQFYNINILLIILIVLTVIGFVFTFLTNIFKNKHAY